MNQDIYDKKRAEFISQAQESELNRFFPVCEVSGIQVDDSEEFTTSAAFEIGNYENVFYFFVDLDGFGYFEYPTDFGFEVVEFLTFQEALTAINLLINEAI
tara:strand:- start:238 stop:540 length:303 start_codon:yes stop_codon:yes gene_type:complete